MLRALGTGYMQRAAAETQDERKARWSGSKPTLAHLCSGWPASRPPASSAVTYTISRRIVFKRRESRRRRQVDSGHFGNLSAKYRKAFANSTVEDVWLCSKKKPSDYVGRMDSQPIRGPLCSQVQTPVDGSERVYGLYSAR